MHKKKLHAPAYTYNRQHHSMHVMNRWMDRSKKRVHRCAYPDCTWTDQPETNRICLLHCWHVCRVREQQKTTHAKYDIILSITNNKIISAYTWEKSDSQSIACFQKQPSSHDRSLLRWRETDKSTRKQYTETKENSWSPAGWRTYSTMGLSTKTLCK